MQLSTAPSLSAQLTRFGLDPRQWSIRRHSRQTALLVHKQDPDFSFVGLLTKKNDGWRWRELRLRSL